MHLNLLPIGTRAVGFWHCGVHFNLILLITFYTVPGIMAFHTNGEDLRMGNLAQVEVG